jgi:hypothetical protein
MNVALLRSLLLGVVCIGVLAAQSPATPSIDGATLNLRVFNDDAGSTLGTSNNYPVKVEISDTPTGTGFANLHIFHLATGGTEAVFNNGDSFQFSADLTISGAGEGEAGLQVAPWWSQDVDGRFNFRTSDGEIAVFGGRLPFYSFTGSQGLTYIKGDTVRVGVDYQANSLTMGDPATIKYTLTMGGTDYTSGTLAFDQGNPSEDPPYGVWGMLNDARVGGFVQVFTGVSGDGNNVTATWENMRFVPEPSSCALLLLGCAALFLAARRKLR